MENVRFDFGGLWSAAGRQQKCFSCSREWAGVSVSVGMVSVSVALCSQLRVLCNCAAAN